MSSDAPPAAADRVKQWEDRWETGRTEFHVKNVHQMLVKHIEKLNPDGKLNKIFVPLCGKSLDMKWLAQQGIITVGVEGVQQALEEFFTESGLERTETVVSQLGSSGKLLTSKDGTIKLYCGDMMEFSPAFEGTFDAMWDRGSLVALDRQDVPRYVQILKELLQQGGRMLVEVMEYDEVSMSELDPSRRPPPPHAMRQEEMKRLFEPHCTVEKIDNNTVQFFGGKDLHLIYYLITKK